MSTSLDEALSTADRQVIDQLQSAVDQLTPAGYRKILSLLAGRCLAAEGGSLALENDAGQVFACLYSTSRPVYDFTAEFSDDELAAINRNLSDPENLMTLEVMLARLDAEDGRTGSPR